MACFIAEPAVAEAVATAVTVSLAAAALIFF